MEQICRAVRTTLTRSAAVLVNLCAAVVSVVAFVGWKQLQEPEHSVKAPYEGDFFYELVDDVGHAPKPNARMTDRGEAEGHHLYDVTYSTGPDGFRVVPKASADSTSCVLLLGGSFVFGNGVQDSETFAAQLVKLGNGRVAVHNFGITGWGPHQVLAGLQSGRFQRAVRCKPTDAVVLVSPVQIWWANGVFNKWDVNGPRYRLDGSGSVHRVGKLGDPEPYNWRRWIGLNRVSRRDAIGVAMAIIVAAMNELKRSYPGIRTHFISYRVSSWDDVDLSASDLLGFEYGLHQAGVMPLSLDAIIPYYRFAQSDYIFSSTDHHPNARAHRLIAEFILREITRSQRGTNAAEHL